MTPVRLDKCVHLGGSVLRLAGLHRAAVGLERMATNASDSEAASDHSGGIVHCIEAFYAGDVGSEEVDAVTVEVAAGSVAVLGGTGVGVAGEDPGVAEWDACVECVGDGCVT